MTPLSVLYVDDDADIRSIVAMSLSLDPAVEVTLAGSAAEALAILADAPLPDVAVFDVMMPGMNGVALMERLAAERATAHLPVIIITARTREADLASYAAAGAIGVILKPFDPLELSARVRGLLDAHEARRSVESL